MSNSHDMIPPPQGQFLVYRAENGQTKVEVRLEGETAWLTQAHMAELFQTTVPNVSMHLRNIYAEGEWQAAATVKEFLIVRQEGNRQVLTPADSVIKESFTTAETWPDQQVVQRVVAQLPRHPPLRQGNRGRTCQYLGPRGYERQAAQTQEARRWQMNHASLTPAASREQMAIACTVAEMLES